MCLICWIESVLGFKKRRMKRFVENMDKMWTVNPRFCEHAFYEGKCSICGLTVDDWVEQIPYNMVSEL